MIVIIGTNKQYQCEIIKDKLLEKNFPVSLVDFAQNSDLSIQFVNGRPEITCNGNLLENVKVVYHDPKYLITQFGDSEEWVEKYINTKGWKTTNHNVFALLDGVKLNSLSVIWLASLKLNQLKIALEVGFHIPPSLVSNLQKDLLSFSEAQKEIITKDFGDGPIPDLGPPISQKVIMTSPVTREMIAQSGAKEPFPILVQKNIRKKYEYRIIVVGTELIAFRVDSNQHPIMNQDYRRGGFMVQYKKVDLEPLFKEKLMRLHQRFELFSGSYDFIESVDGTYYFLEVNPAGVWAYIDKICNGDVSDLFVSEISKIYNRC